MILSYKKRLYSNQRHCSPPTISRPTKVRVCVPTSIYQSVSFVVNLDHIDSHKDVLADDMGVWKHNGVDTVLVSVTFTEEHIQMVRRLNLSIPPGGQMYSVKHVYRTHATDSTLKKVTAYIYGWYVNTSIQIICEHCMHTANSAVH